MKTRIKSQQITPEQEAQFYREFASWSKERKYEYIKKSPKERVWRLKYTWRAWARGKQLAPEGNWSTWVIKAGRGFGKTRSGAEWVIEKAQEYPGCHIALVGRTVADVRDVMIKGLSGILTVSPPWFKPTYYPSKRLLIWSNGSYATTYSAEEPDQMRGPQHSFAWADERCFIAGTLIRTSKGLIPIEEIRPGDLVYTRGGLKRVKYAGLTNPSTTVYDLETSDGRVLTGTGNHPIWVQDKGFKPLHSLSSGDILMSWDQLKLNTVSSGMDADGGSTTDTIATEEESCYTEPSMHPYTGQFLQEWTSTTETKTKPITISQILRCLHDLNIRRGIGLEGGQSGTTKKDSEQVGSSGQTKSRILSPVLSVVRSLTLLVPVLNSALKIAEQHTDAKTLHRFLQLSVTSAANRSWPTEKECAIALLNAHMQLEKSLNRKNSVSPVGKAFMRMIQGPYAAQENVVSPTKIEILLQKREYASIARKLFQLISPHRKRSFAQEHAEICTETKENSVKVLKVKQCSEKMAVFNMEVEDCHEYFANDVLVHNCSWQYDDAWDQLMFGLRISPAPGIEPQCVVTTTPRNTKAMKELLKDPGTVVTHGSMYDNRENLSKRFIHEIDRKYKGTRLGRQEIDGDLIDDIDGALWKRKWIEDNRVQRGDHPELKRIVVGVDPPGSSQQTSEEPAECGIVVVGLGVNNHGYVLADYSLVGTPNEWASEAIKAYDFFKADRIIGEINFGGEMVGTIIKSLAKERGLDNIPFKAVRASRGKQVRAEPVSNLYQQNSVHHVGVLPDLEDQQCNWIPGEKSPDRLDACVWSITELMLDGKQGGGVYMEMPSEEEQQAYYEDDNVYSLWR